MAPILFCKVFVKIYDSDPDKVIAVSHAVLLPGLKCNAIRKDFLVLARLGNCVTKSTSTRESTPVSEKRIRVLLQLENVFNCVMFDIRDDLAEAIVLGDSALSVFNTTISTNRIYTPDAPAKISNTVSVAGKEVAISGRKLSSFYFKRKHHLIVLRAGKPDDVLRELSQIFTQGIKELQGIANDPAKAHSLREKLKEISMMQYRMLAMDKGKEEAQVTDATVVASSNYSDVATLQTSATANATTTRPSNDASAMSPCSANSILGKRKQDTIEK